MGDDFSNADIATLRCINHLIGVYGAADLVGMAGFAQVQRVLQAFLARLAVQRGWLMPQRPAAA